MPSSSPKPEGHRARLLVVLPLALAILAALALHAPTLHSGLVADDYLQVAMLDGRYPVARSSWDLYSFSCGAEDVPALMRHGVLPWWSHPELKLSALRPLSSLLLALDVALGLPPWARHLHSLAWLVAFMCVAAALFRRTLTPWAAAVAALIVAVTPAHVWPAGWLANRTALVSATLGLGAVVLQLRRRDDPSHTSAWAVPVLVTAALAAGEYALSVAGLVFGFELLARDGWRHRARRLLPWAAPALGYFVLHKALGYGAFGSSVYVDPIASPLKFVLAILLRLPALLASELFLLPSELVHGALVLSFGLSLGIVVGLCSAFALVAALALRGRAEARRTALTYFSGLCCSLLPLVATLPSSRMLVVPSVAGSALVATVCVALLASPRRHFLLRALAAGAGLLLAALHLPIAAFHTSRATRQWSELHTRIAEMAATAELPASATSWVLLNAAEPTAIYLPWMRRREAQPTFAVLSISPEPLTVLRSGDRTLELVAGEHGMLTDPASRLFRGLETPFPEAPVATGDVVVQVKELSPFGVKRIRVEFRRPFDDPALLVLVLDGGRLRRFTPPALGGSARIPGL
ncbi:MAG: hypothetical protein R3B13_30580 [Polyangiaceae bacterium]